MSGDAAHSDDKAKSETKGALYHCDYCRADISQLVRIKCAECEDFDLCVRCFAMGAHVPPHKPDHAYRVVDYVRTPLWAPEWGADEELLLLEALEMYGMGNWSDVAEHVGSKNKQQCEQHYADVYCSTKDLLPDPAKALTRKPKTEGEAGADAAAEASVKQEADSKRAGTPSTTGKPMAKAHAVSKPKPKTGLGHLVGYIPNRGDFDTEYENDAELTLADMEFKDEDTKWERDLKLKVIEIYNSKLDARAERKKFILERGLLERKEKKRSKEEREIANNMRVFARFHSQEEHEAFIQGLLNEVRIRKRIEQLQNWRVNGIRSLADGELFEAELRKRQAMLGNKKPGAADALGTGAAAAGGKGASKKRSAADQSEDERLAKSRKEAGAKGASAAAAASAAGMSASPAASSSVNPDWDVSKMPGHELLSTQERHLCSTLQLLPQHYFMIKERLIRECFTRGFVKENQSKQLIKIDVNKTAKVFDFFVSVGWLNTHDLMSQNVKPQGGMPTAPAAAASSSAAAAAPAAAATSYPQGAPPAGGAMKRPTTGGSAPTQAAYAAAFGGAQRQAQPQGAAAANSAQPQLQAPAARFP